MLKPLRQILVVIKFERPEKSQIPSMIFAQGLPNAFLNTEFLGADFSASENSYNLEVQAEILKSFCGRDVSADT
jgi:hypothetical protein